ncbi:MAG: DUF1737 domain-containing protein [Caldilineaceae bacterium]
MDDLQYEILQENDLTVLQRKVNERIGQGWVPLGGVSVAAGDGSDIFAQAMTSTMASRLEFGEGRNSAWLNRLSVDATNVAAKE